MARKLPRTALDERIQKPDKAMNFEVWAPLEQLEMSNVSASQTDGAYAGYSAECCPHVCQHGFVCVTMEAAHVRHI